MGLFTPAVRRLVALFYHCFNRIVIHAYLTGVLMITKETLSQRTDGYQEPAGPRRARAKRSVSCRWLRMVKKDAQEFGRPAAHKSPEVFGTRLHPHASGQAFHHHRSDRVQPSCVLQLLDKRRPVQCYFIRRITILQVCSPAN